MSQAFAIQPPVVRRAATVSPTLSSVPANVHFRSQTTEWETSPLVFQALDREFGFTLDVCATAKNAKCRRFFTKEMDGLAHVWSGRCWMNPPYGRELGKWIAKARESATAGATIVCLLPARTDTRWFHDEVLAFAAEVRFVRGRLRFGDAINAAPFPSLIAVFTPASAALRKAGERRSRPRICTWVPPHT